MGYHVALSRMWFPGLGDCESDDTQNMAQDSQEPDRIDHIDDPDDY